MLIPLKLKDAVTLGNILGGLASALAAMEGSLDWACIFMLIAWVFDMFDGTVARLTGTGNNCYFPLQRITHCYLLPQ